MMDRRLSLLALALPVALGRGSPNDQVDNGPVRRMFRDVKVADIEQVEIVGPRVWIDADPGPGEDMRPNVVRDPRLIRSMLDAFRASTHWRSVEPTASASGPTDQWIFRFRKGLGNEDLYIGINDVSVLQDFGPSVQRMYVSYRQRTDDQL